MELGEAISELEREWGISHSHEIERVARSVSDLQD